MVPVYSLSGTMGLIQIYDCQQSLRQCIQPLLVPERRFVSASSEAVSLCPQPKPSVGGVWLVKGQKRELGLWYLSVREQAEVIQMKQWAVSHTLSSMAGYLTHKRTCRAKHQCM